MGLIIPVFLYSFVYMYSFTKWFDNIKHCQPKVIQTCSWNYSSHRMQFDLIKHDVRYLDTILYSDSRWAYH